MNQQHRYVENQHKCNERIPFPFPGTLCEEKKGPKMLSRKQESRKRHF